MPLSQGKYGRWTTMVSAITQRSHYLLSFLFISVICSASYLVNTILSHNVYVDIAVKLLFLASAALIAPRIYAVLVMEYQEKGSPGLKVVLEGKEAEEARAAAEKLALQAEEELLKAEEEEKKKGKEMKKELGSESGKGKQRKK